MLCAPFTLIALKCGNPLPTAQASDCATAQSYVPIGQSQVLVWRWGQELRVRHRTSLREDHRPEPRCSGGRRSATRLMYKTFCGCFVLGLFRAGSNRRVIDERTKPDGAARRGRSGCTDRPTARTGCVPTRSAENLHRFSTDLWKKPHPNDQTFALKRFSRIMALTTPPILRKSFTFAAFWT